MSAVAPYSSAPSARAFVRDRGTADEHADAGDLFVEQGRVGGLAAGAHTAVITVLGQRNPAATNTIATFRGFTAS